MKIDLLTKIKDVLEDSMTARDVYEMLIKKYPEALQYKIECYNSEKKGESQLYSEIGSRIIEKEGKLFEIDRNEKPYKIFWIVEDEDNENDDIEDNEIINIEDKNEYVYIIDTHINHKDRGIYKIGRAKDPKKRINQLNKEQSSYFGHTVIKLYKTERPHHVEKAIHHTLDRGRVSPNKEGFYADYVIKHIDIIETIVNTINGK